MDNKYRKKPVVIEAIQWTGENLREVLEFTGKAPRWSEWFSSFDEYEAHVRSDRNAFKVFTLEGIMEANPGDWIIRGVSGEHYPCKPDIFAKTYDPADALEAQAEQVAVARAEGYAAGIEAAKKCFEGGVGVPVQSTYDEVREEIHALHTADSLAALDRARQEERERCAKVAATFVHSRLYEPNHPVCSYHSKDIAAAILGGEDE